MNTDLDGLTRDELLMFRSELVDYVGFLQDTPGADDHTRRLLRDAQAALDEVDHVLLLDKWKDLHAGGF